MPPPTPTVYPNLSNLITPPLFPHDVLSGRGQKVHANPGNIHFQSVVMEYTEEYHHPMTRKPDKMHVAARLVNDVRRKGGRFLRASRENRGRYVEIGDEKAWEKAAASIRDAHKTNKDDSITNNESSTLVITQKKQPPAKKQTVQKQPAKQLVQTKNGSASSLSKSKQSPRATTTTTTTNSSVNSQKQQSQQRAGRLVIVRPNLNGGDATTSNKLLNGEQQQQQWPLYNRLCQAYGFVVDVEQYLSTIIVAKKDGSDVCGGGGPRTSLLLDNDDGKVVTTTKKKDPLQCISERLVIRPFVSPSASPSGTSGKRKSSGSATSSVGSGKKKKNSTLHPELNEGDVIQTLDGKPNPTFGKLYAMMSRNEKLVLEIVDSSGSVPTNGGEHGDKNDRRGEAVANKTSSPATSNASKNGQSGGLGNSGARVASSVAGADTSNSSRTKSNSDESAGRRRSHGKESDVSPVKRPSRWGPKTDGSTSPVPAGASAHSPTPDTPPPQRQSRSSSTTTPSNPYVQTDWAYQPDEVNQLGRNTKANDNPHSFEGEQNQDEPHSTENVHKRQRTEACEEKEEVEDEVALFDMVEEQLMQASESIVNDEASASQPTAVATTASSTTNDSHPPPNAKAVNISSSSSPTLFDCPGDNDDDRISISSSSSSSSSGSSSSSSSDSSNSCDSRSAEKNLCGQMIQALPPPKSSAIQPLQNCYAQSTKNNQHQPFHPLPYANPLMGDTNKSLPSKKAPLQTSTRVSLPSKPAPQLQASRFLSTRMNLPSNPAPQLQASRKRPPTIMISTATTSSSSLTSGLNNLIEAPTSLSRLWPDPSDVIKALTRWTPPIAQVRRSGRGIQTVEFYGPIQCNYNGLENERNNPLLQSNTMSGGRDSGRDIPTEYKDAGDIMAAMAHPLMNEGLCSLNGGYHASKYGNGRWNRDVYHLRLTKLTEVEPIFKTKSFFRDNIKMYEAQFSAHGETNMPPSNLSELYCMHFKLWGDSKFGIVAHDFPTTITFRKYNEGKSLLKLWLVVHQNERETKDTGWLSRKEFKSLLDPHKNGLIVNQNAIFTLISCGSTTNIVRQFEAIKCLPYLKPHLQRALFTSCITNASKPGPTTKPRSLPMDIWRSLSKSHNSYQLSSISQVLTGSCRENVCLVQGPPGTGKSSTIVGLVSALLSGKAPLPRQRQSGCLIHPGKTMGATFAEPQARNRILVCAATNQAVDTLAWKIKQGSLGPSGKIGDFTMGRFGSLPWELSRDSSNQKPELLSAMEDFLYEINVDRKASDGIQDFEWGEEEEREDNAKPQRKKRRKIVGRAKLRSQILGNCSVVITTLSGAGSKAFIDAVCRDPTRNDSEFDAIVIDEACQASEPESLIPFKYNPTTITLVGDPKQLPVLTLSGSSSNNKLFERSLFERLQSLNFPTILLRNQYRMHQSIATFPSEEFYQGKLITPDSVKKRVAPSWSCPCFPTICFWDTNGRNMQSGSMGHGYTNRGEADFITQTILTTFAHAFLTRSDAELTVGIISFYKDQVKLLKEQLARIPALNNSRLNIKVATVDGFQGSECDIIILSCVRSHERSGGRGGQRRNTVGFLNDYRRVNVAITRAKCSLWIVGNTDVLKASDLWRKLIHHVDNQRMMRRSDEFRDLFARWKASTADIIHVPTLVCPLASGTECTDK